MGIVVSESEKSVTEAASAAFEGVEGAVGLGVDIVEIARMRRILERTPSFREKVFSEEERSYCESTANPEVHYATRFAAKEAVLKAAGETGAIMTIEDHSIFGGLGSAVAEVVVGNCPVPMEIVGIQDRFGESGDPELIYKDHGMDMDSIVAKAKALVARKG